VAAHRNNVPTTTATSDAMEWKMGYKRVKRIKKVKVVMDQAG